MLIDRAAVYGKTGGRSERFLASMKEALRTIAKAQDELNDFYSLDLNQSAGGICRLSATLHLFHHQVKPPNEQTIIVS